MIRIITFLYQWLIAMPILLILTILTALTTLIGCRLGNGNFWGYYPAHIWSRLFCILSLVKIEVRGRENIDKNTSYVFVSNHQGAYDIFLIYGYLNHNFKWMMKKSLRKIPFVGKACESAGHIFVDRSGPKKVLETIRQAKDSLKDGVSLVVFPKEHVLSPDTWDISKKGRFNWQMTCSWQLFPLQSTVLLKSCHVQANGYIAIA